MSLSVGTDSNVHPVVIHVDSYIACALSFSKAAVAYQGRLQMPPGETVSDLQLVSAEGSICALLCSCGLLGQCWHSRQGPGSQELACVLSCSCSQSRREAEWLLLLVSFRGAVKGRWNCGRCCKPYSMSEVGVFVKQPGGDATAVCP